MCHLSGAEFGHSLLIFNHPCVITGFFPPSNFGYAKIGQKLIKSCHFLKRRIEPKKRTFKIPHVGSICSICLVCHRSVAEFGHSLLVFNHPCVITGFFPPSNFGYEPRWAKNCSKVVIFEKENWTKKTHFSKFRILGLYAVYALCAILVLQNLGIVSSFSTIHVWLQASFPLQISVMSQDWPKIDQNVDIFEKENGTKRRTFQISYLGSICSRRKFK